jgi:hypothetical protein
LRFVLPPKNRSRKTCVAVAGMPMPLSFAANLVELFGDECVGHAALMQGTKRLNGTWDRIVVSIGHAIEMRDDAFDWMVRTRITPLLFWYSIQVRCRRHPQVTCAEPLFWPSIIVVLHT